MGELCPVKGFGAVGLTDEPEHIEHIPKDASIKLVYITQSLINVSSQ